VSLSYRSQFDASPYLFDGVLIVMCYSKNCPTWVWSVVWALLSDESNCLIQSEGIGGAHRKGERYTLLRSWNAHRQAALPLSVGSVSTLPVLMSLEKNI